MVNYDWPGNVRELENAIERAIVLAWSESVQPDDLPDSILEKDPPAGVAAVKYHANVKEFKKQLILNAMGAKPKAITLKRRAFWECIRTICIA